MENVTSGFLLLLQYLLPGFLSAWIFYGFTSFQKPSQFERVIQALIFTLIVQVLVLFVSQCLKWWDVVSWRQEIELITSVIIAIKLGFVFALFANNDGFHKVIRKLRITRETSYPSEWFGEFSNQVTYVVLHLKGERRIYGWPKEWPSNPDKGHFSLNQASWLTDDGETQLIGVEAILIAAKDVEMVEFMKKTWESSNE